MFRKASFYQKLYTILIMIGFMYYLQYWIRQLNQDSLPALQKWLQLPDKTQTNLKAASEFNHEIVLTDNTPEVKKPVRSTKKAVAKDDLKAIEGIGPRSEQTLYAGGISTYKQLAALNSDSIRTILKAGNINANPETWAQQAALAAAGKWDELTELQAQLKGGLKS